MLFELQILREPDAIAALQPAWHALIPSSQRHMPTLDDLVRDVTEHPSRFVVFARREAESVAGICCFDLYPYLQSFALGERKLFSIRAKTATLYGDNFLGVFTDEDWRTIVQYLKREFGINLIRMGEVPIESPLMNALARVRCPDILVGTRARTSMRWLIELPDSFDAYLGRLRASTRQSVRRKLKRIETLGDCRFELVARSEDVARFLTMGEAISRQTYQWDVGQRLLDDAETRTRYERLSDEGRLRCYLLFRGGRAVAFLRGEIAGRVYNYETPGFVPDAGDLSPGIVLLAHAVSDLIENTDCTLFDFGTGGDMSGYKSRFGTTNIACRNVMIADAKSIDGMSVWILTSALDRIKALSRLALGDGELKRRVKKLIRRYDAPRDPN